MKKIISLFAAVMMLVASGMSVAASTGEPINEAGHDHILDGAVESWVTNGNIDNPKVGDIIENGNGERTVIIRIEDDGTIVAVDQGAERMALTRACDHHSQYLQKTGTSDAEYSKYNDAYKCYKYRTRWTNKCTNCGYSPIYTYSLWTDQNHSFNPYTGQCILKMNGGSVCGYKK